QIILSRAHANFVKKLFELEVPEIYEGIVEIKSIARTPGERTKIAVYSKDDKVDCVGACVGMRGARVKNIVSELQGEKIDIVRYSSDIKEYIQAALSPAEISQIQVNSDVKKANLIVADDQLSLAIGKRGQNVRLASELVGWELNIFTADQWQKQQEETDSSAGTETPLQEGNFQLKEKPSKSKKGAEVSLSDLEGVGEKTLHSLNEAGFDSLEKIAQASVDDLTQVEGLGKIKAEKLIKQAKNLLDKK
ncbi:MAG: transcription termination/antitermination protein NusA, partial [Candidatus Omnitrophica bacterium]|nr:transcription termination/antitermination protein NusA [Candidatus Omnitrophota bacterium]